MQRTYCDECDGQLDGKEHFSVSVEKFDKDWNRDVEFENNMDLCLACATKKGVD